MRLRTLFIVSLIGFLFGLLITSPLFVKKANVEEEFNYNQLNEVEKNKYKWFVQENAESMHVVRERYIELFEELDQEEINTERVFNLIYSLQEELNLINLKQGKNHWISEYERLYKYTRALQQTNEVILNELPIMNKHKFIEPYFNNIYYNLSEAFKIAEYYQQTLKDELNNNKKND